MTKPTILVVEDNPAQQMILNLVLAKYGFALQIVSSGQAAIEAISTPDSDYGAVLMDVSLPDMDGYACTKRIRDFEGPRGKHTPIIAVTAHAMKGDSEKCLQAGMDDYLSKPYLPEELRRHLTRLTSNSFEPNLAQTTPV